MISFSYIVLISCLMYVALSVHVILQRRRTAQGLGNQLNDASLERAIRAHGNFCEITPFALFPLYLLVQSPASEGVILLLGIIFIVGRLLHASSLVYIEPTYEIIKIRVTGMALSFISIIVSCGVYSRYLFF